MSCYACGQPEIDPVADGQTFCDLTIENNQCDKTKDKMYNMTCDIMDKLGATDSWLRQAEKYKGFENQTGIAKKIAGSRGIRTYYVLSGPA